MKTPLSLRDTIGTSFLTSMVSTSVFAQLSTFPAVPPPSGFRRSVDVINNVMVPRTGNQLSLSPSPPPLNLGSFDISIIPGPDLIGNAPALAAFNRAAASWEARIMDPISVNINANLGPLAAGTIGTTSLVTLNSFYNVVRDQIILDGADEPSNGITAFLPTYLDFRALIPGPIPSPGHLQDSLTGEIVATKANLKALGFTGLDVAFGNSDADITFSNFFSFDFDNSDGVGPGLIDFETVAAHEIGHALGFFSIVDSLNTVDQVSASIPPLDLFRFSKGATFDPITATDFSTFPRNFLPGATAFTDEIFGPNPELLMSTGTLDLSFPFAGRDGNQASHWKDNDITGIFIGLMDPNLGPGQFYGPNESDFRALDLIGYDILVVPEPTGVCSIIALSALVLQRLSRRA